MKSSNFIKTTKEVVGILLAIGIAIGNMVFDKEISLNLLVIPAMLLGISLDGLSTIGKAFNKTDNHNEDFDDYEE